MSNEPENKELQEEVEKQTPTEEETYEYAGNYFVYGMAIGVMVGAVLFFLFGQNKILLCAATLVGMVVGACMKQKPKGNDKHE